MATAVLAGATALCAPGLLLAQTTIPPAADYAEYRGNWGLGMIDVLSANKARYTGKGAVVAIVDDGPTSTIPSSLAGSPTSGRRRLRTSRTSSTRTARSPLRMAPISPGAVKECAGHWPSSCGAEFPRGLGVIAAALANPVRNTAASFAENLMLGALRWLQATRQRRQIAELIVA